MPPWSWRNDIQYLQVQFRSSPKRIVQENQAFTTLRADSIHDSCCILLTYVLPILGDIRGIIGFPKLHFHLQGILNFFTTLVIWIFICNPFAGNFHLLNILLVLGLANNNLLPSDDHAQVTQRLVESDHDKDGDLAHHVGQRAQCNCSNAKSLCYGVSDSDVNAEALPLNIWYSVPFLPIRCVVRFSIRLRPHSSKPNLNHGQADIPGSAPERQERCASGGR